MILVVSSLVLLTSCEATFEAATVGVEGQYETPAEARREFAERRVGPNEIVPIGDVRLLPAPTQSSLMIEAINWNGLYPYGGTLIPHGNSDPSGMDIEVEPYLYVDDSRTSRVGVVPSPEARPGQTFRLRATMATDVQFRVEARYYADDNSIIWTDTSAPLVEGPGMSELYSQAPPGTEYMLLRIYLDDVDFGENHRVAGVSLERAEGLANTPHDQPPPTVTIAPTTTRRPPTTTIASTTTSSPVTTAPPTTTTAPPATTAPPTTITAPPTTTAAPGDTPVSLALNSSNTGVVGGQNAGVCSNNLTNYNGQLIIDNAWVAQHGNVLENFDINGALLIKADNVTFRCGRVSGGWGYTVDVKAKGAVFEWFEAGQDDDGKTILGGNYTAYRCNVHGGEDSVHINTGTVTITECYIHDQNFIGNDPHPDAIQVTSGGTVQNVTVIRSKLISFYKAPNAALQINVANSWSITESYLWGGVYSILGDPGNPGVVTNNYFGWDSSQYGAIGGVSTSRSGNVWWEWVSPKCSGAYSANVCSTPGSHPGNGTPI
ncbi:MAG: hypothetical protein ACI9C1_000079 [Candidatus Aldehydirespiratoraceae bacterium]|jgi:hypothetical protein